MSQPAYSAMIKLWRLAPPGWSLRPDSPSTDPEFFPRGMVKLATDAPVLVDHRRDRQIGFVRSLSEVEETDGKWWIFAHATILDPPCWLERDTPASIATVTWRDKSRPRDGIVQEVSVVSPTRKPREKKAKVVLYQRDDTLSRTPGGEVIVSAPQRRIQRAQRRFTVSDAEVRERLCRAIDSGVDGAVEREVAHLKALSGRGDALTALAVAHGYR